MDKPQGGPRKAPPSRNWTSLVVVGSREEEAASEKGQWSGKSGRPIHKVFIQCRHVEAHGFPTDVGRGGTIASGTDDSNK